MDKYIELILMLIHVSEELLKKTEAHSLIDSYIWNFSEDYSEKNCTCFELPVNGTLSNELFVPINEELVKIVSEVSLDVKEKSLMIYIGYLKEGYKREKKIVLILKEISQKVDETNRYLYHITEKRNRESIWKNGLLPMSFKDSAWKRHPPLLYPDAVFANNTEDFTWWFPLDEWLWIPVHHEDKEVWRIDTWKCDNIWYKDTNVSCSVFTTKPVPKEALSLFGINSENIQRDDNTLMYGLSVDACLYPLDPVSGLAIEEPRLITPEYFRFRFWDDELDKYLNQLEKYENKVFSEKYAQRNEHKNAMKQIHHLMEDHEHRNKNINKDFDYTFRY